MTTRQPSMTEQKLVTLYALDRLGPTTALQLLRFMVENEMMDYIALQLSTAELDEMGLLRKLPHALGALYAPSAQGYKALDLFRDRIPYSRATEIDAIAPNWKRRFREEKQVLGDWEKMPSGEYQVHLKLLESELPLLEMHISLPTREQATQFCARWPQEAGALYAHLMHTLGENEQAKSTGEVLDNPPEKSRKKSPQKSLEKIPEKFPEEADA